MEYNIRGDSKPSILRKENKMALEKVVTIVEGIKSVSFKESISIPQEVNVNFSELIQDVVNAKNMLKEKRQELNRFLKELTASEKAVYQARIDEVLKND